MPMPSMDYARYYFSTLFMAAGVAGFVLGGAWVWLGAATLPIVVLLDLLALEPDFSTRRIRLPWLADVPRYLHALLVPVLVGTAVMRIRSGSPDGGPLGLGQLAGVAVTLAWLGVVPNIPVAHDRIRVLPNRLSK